MKTPSIILASAVVLGFAQEAGAITVDAEYRHTAYFAHGYTVTIGTFSFGLVDGYETTATPGVGKYICTCLCFASQSVEVPFTAIQGLIGFGFMLAMLIVLPIAFTVQWQKNRAVP